MFIFDIIVYTIAMPKALNLFKIVNNFSFEKIRNIKNVIKTEKCY